MAKARYSPTTPIETTAKKATGVGTSAPLIGIRTVTRAGNVISAAMTADRMTPLAGTLFLLSVDHSFQPGTARSRLNAKSIRDELVIQAMVQKNCPAVEMISTMPTQPELIDWVKIVYTPPPLADTSVGSWTANRNASNRIQPPIAE